MEKEKEVKEQDSQAPQAPRSGAAAEGSQSPDPFPIHTEDGYCRKAPPSAGSEGRQSPGPAAHWNFCASIYDASQPCNCVPPYLRAALAAPGAPQGVAWTPEALKKWAAPCGCVLDLSYWYCPTHQSADADRTPSQEEGPAGVDLEQAASIIESCGYDLIAAGLRRLRAQAPASPPRDLESQSVSLGDPIGQEADENLEDDRLARIIGDFEDERSISYDDIGKVCYALRFVRRQRAAQPPEATPIEAAGLEAMMAEAMDMLENWPMPKIGNPLREEMFADRKALRVAWKAYQAAPKAGTPIEKAAREGLQYAVYKSRELQREAEESHASKSAVLGAARVAVEARLIAEIVENAIKRLGASLSGLPQEAPAGGWYDPAHDCEDHCTMCQGLKARRAAQEGAAGEGEPLPSVGGASRLTAEMEREAWDDFEDDIEYQQSFQAHVCAAEQEEDVSTFQDYIREHAQICFLAGLRTTLEARSAPEGLPEGSNPSNPGATQEGAQEPKEGGAQP